MGHVTITNPGDAKNLDDGKGTVVIITGMGPVWAPIDDSIDAIAVMQAIGTEFPDTIAQAVMTYLRNPVHITEELIAALCEGVEKVEGPNVPLRIRLAELLRVADHLKDPLL